MLPIQVVSARPTLADFVGESAIATWSDLAVPTTGGPVMVKIVTAPREEPRPTVLILHGMPGIEHPLAAYVRYAEDLAAAGIDAWLFSYYSSADDEVMHRSGADQQIARFQARFHAWVKTVREIADFAQDRTANSGRTGLLGFSNGGFLAVGTAAVDPRIAALVVFYGGIPEPMQDEITRLPPLLVLHGTADRIIPVIEGEALLVRARELGDEQAELVVYPDADHCFDFDPTSEIANEARARAIAFLRSRLAAN